MCPDRFSLSFHIIKSALPEVERAIPGHGCELVHAMASVSDTALLAGLATGLALSWVLYDVGSSVMKSRRYREWKVSRHAD